MSQPQLADQHVTSVPEWTRCHGITVPDEDVLFQAAGGSVEIWRQIFERVSQMRVCQLRLDPYLFYFYFDLRASSRSAA